jgi:hypothetical protein
MFSGLWILAAVIVIAALGWSLWRRFAADDMQRLNDHRRDSCRLVGTAELVEGNQHIPVALALSSTTLYYENADLKATLELRLIDEVEYANELVTGQPVHGGKVMRLRSFSRMFEFVLDPTSAPRWQAELPAVRLALQ